MSVASNAIYLSINSRIYQFLTFWLENSDGSFYVALGESKKKRISYHSTGRVNYHHFPTKDITFRNFEPLYRLNRGNLILEMTVYDIEKLSPYTGNPRDQDSVIEIQLNPLSPILNFSFVVVPWDQVAEVDHFSVRFKDLFALTIFVTSEALDQKPALPFRYGFPPNAFEQQSIDKDQGLIDFHQRAKQTREPILYSPNQEGVYKLVFDVPMVRRPEFRISFFNPEYRAEAESCTKSALRFKIKDKYGNTVKREVPIAGFELDARL